ncbi:MAG: ABC transporter permease [Verrucomicrobiales bacterium]|nr:ABC transporter permease [Verrucomicrobiales bacterium]
MSLRPFAWLLAALFLAGLILVQATEYFDEYPFWGNVMSDPFAVSAVTFILSMVVALGLMVRESDEGTLLYLDGLPVRRITVYFSKWLIAVLLILCLNFLWVVEGLVYDWFSRTSASPPTPWRSIGVFVALESFLSVFFVTLLIGFSFLRRGALLALGAVFWLVFWLKSMQVPYAELLDPFLLIQTPSEMDTRWEWPVLQLAFMSVVLVAIWWIGFGLFSIRPGWSGNFSRLMRDTWWGKLTGGCSIVLIAVVWIGLLTVTSWDEGMEEAHDAIADLEAEQDLIREGNNVLTEESLYFRFIFRGKVEKRMNHVIAGADSVYEKVADFLKVPEEMREDLITVDLSSPLASHNAGQAYWKKIRMALPERPGKGKKREAETFAILGHELTHVFIDQLTKGRLEESFDSARWFHEGLASYVEFKRFRPAGAENGYLRWVGLASHWGEVHFSEMVENNVLSSLRDPFLAYPAGYLWVDSLVRVYGDDAPAKLLTAIGREEGPRKLQGMALWRDACLATDFDLERVRSDFRVQLKELRAKYRKRLGSLPEVTEGKASRKGGKILVIPEFPEEWKEGIPEGFSLVCRMRPRLDSPPMQWRYSKLSEEDTFSVPALGFLAKEIGFQVGWRANSKTQPIFGEWVNVVVEEGE